MTYLFYVEIRITGQQTAGSSVSVLGNSGMAVIFILLPSLIRIHGNH